VGQRKQLYSLTDGDREILAASADNPNLALDYFLRSKSSGTYWLPGCKSDIWKYGYETLYDQWRYLGKPWEFEHNGRSYEVQTRHANSKAHPDDPCFFDNHGPQLLPWAESLYTDDHFVTTIVGGFGSGKSMNVMLMLLLYAITLPNFRAFLLGPEAKQATQLWSHARNAMRGTLYEKYFLIADPKSPHPSLTIGHDGVGECVLETFPLKDNVDSMKNLEADMAVVDQAEMLPDLQSIIELVGSRFRGRDMQTGREKLGKLIFIANSEDNLALWEVFDRAQEYPDDYLSLQPHTRENYHITDRDLSRYEAIYANDPEGKERGMAGARPLGNGDIFSRQIIANMQLADLDRAMAWGQLNKESGYVVSKNLVAGTFEWLLPPIPGHKYLVVSDPGASNPPGRNSAPIGIVDYTNFPGTADKPVPAYLVGFVWPYVDGKITNWANKYAELVRLYDAHTSNAIDGTGWQSGYPEWIAILQGLSVQTITLTAANKSDALNSARIISSDGMIKGPVGMDALWSNLSRYEFPEKENARQDIAMMFIMLCWWLKRLYYFKPPTSRDEQRRAASGDGDRHHRKHRRRR
jgi:hypothetical protein